MKILLTTDIYSPMVNGVVTSVLNLKKQLESEGHVVRILTLTQSTNEQPNSFHNGVDNVWYIPSVSAKIVYPGARISRNASPYIKEMISWKPDVVHSQTEFSTFHYAKNIARNTGAILVHTYHTVYEDYTHYFLPFRKWGKRMVKSFSCAILNNADAVIAPSKKVCNMLKKYGISCPIYTVPSGIEYAKNNFESDKCFRNVQTLITVGRLAKEKNIQELLYYLSEERGNRYRFLIVGDGPYRRRLQNIAVKLRIQDRVIFTGMINPTKIAGWYQKGNVFISGSNSESQGLTYIEALASGLPAVCRQDDCLCSVIENGYNGWQYKSESEFFDALEDLDNPNSYNDMSDNARKSSMDYSVELFAKRVLEVYMDCKNRK